MGRLLSRRWLSAIAGITLVTGGLLALPSGAASTVTTVNASGDTYVSSTKANVNKNFGTRTYLRVAGGSNKRTVYVKFAVPATSGTVKKATLFMDVKAAKIPFTVNKTADFNEKAITSKTAPEVGARVISATPTTKGSFGVDVSSAITTGSARTVAFALTSTNKAALNFVSREDKVNHPPALVIVTENGSSSSSTSPTTAQSTTSTTKAATPQTTTTTSKPASSTSTTIAPTIPGYGPTVMPTATMTVQEFISSKTCDNKIITGTGIREGGSSDHIQINGSLVGTTWRMNNCVVNSWLEIQPPWYETASPSTWNVTNTWFKGAMTVRNPIGGYFKNSKFDSRTDFTPQAKDGSINWSYPGPKYPLLLQGNYFYQPQLYFDGDYSKDPSSPDGLCHQSGGCRPHADALSAWGWPDGLTFIGNTIVQQGPNNLTATATVNFHGMNTKFIDNQFRWKDGVATYYTVYIIGPNNTVSGGCMERGINSYIATMNGTETSDPATQMPVSVTNVKDCNTGQVIPWNR